MTIKASCPACSGRFSFDDTQIGQSCSCPHCQATVTLSAPPPPPAPAAPAPAPVGVRKALENRKEFLARVRKETSYGTARGLLTLACALIGAAGVLGFVGAVLALLGMAGPIGVAGPIAATGFVTGAVLVILAIGLHQASIVVFDIADVAIECR